PGVPGRASTKVYGVGTAVVVVVDPDAVAEQDRVPQQGGGDITTPAGHLGLPHLPAVPVAGDGAARAVLLWHQDGVTGDRWGVLALRLGIELFQHRSVGGGADLAHTARTGGQVHAGQLTVEEPECGAGILQEDVRSINRGVLEGSAAVWGDTEVAARRPRGLCLGVTAFAGLDHDCALGCCDRVRVTSATRVHLLHPGFLALGGDPADPAILAEHHGPAGRGSGVPAAARRHGPLLGACPAVEQAQIVR